MHGGAEIIHGGIKKFTEASNNSRRGRNDSRRHQIIQGGAEKIHGGA